MNARLSLLALRPGMPTDPRGSPRLRGTLRAALLWCAALLLGGLGAYGCGGNGSSMVTVPNVVNDAEAAAESAITGAGLTVGQVTMASSATVTSGDVISESPAANTSVASGSAVNLVISTGPPTVNVPAVVGETEAMAETAITGAGLTVGQVTMASSASVTAGDVISESPAANTSVASGSAVNLVISTGPANVATGNVGAAAAAIPLPVVGNFSGTLYAPPTVGGTSTTLTIQVTTSLAALDGQAPASNLPNAAPLYITITLGSAVTFTGPLNLTLTTADGTTYTLQPFVLTGTHALALGPQVLGSSALANVASAAVSVRALSSAARRAATPPAARDAGGASAASTGYPLPPTLLSAAATPNTLVWVGNLGIPLGPFPSNLMSYSTLPAFAPGDTVVLPQDGSNAIRIFAANVSGAATPYLIPQITTPYANGLMPNLYSVQVDQYGTVYALDPYNLAIFSWSWGSNSPPALLASLGALNGVSLVSFAVNPQGTQAAGLGVLPNAQAVIAVVNIATQSLATTFFVPPPAFPTQAENLALDAAGDVYYTNGSTVSVYPPGVASGSTPTPSQTYAPSSLGSTLTTPQIGQMVVQTSSTLGGGVATGHSDGGIAGSVFVAIQSDATPNGTPLGSGDVVVGSFYPAGSGLTTAIQDLDAPAGGNNGLGLISTADAGNYNWLLGLAWDSPVNGALVNFSLGAVDYNANFYLYTTAATNFLAGLAAPVPAVEVFPSAFAHNVSQNQYAFWDGVTAFNSGALASIATVPEPVVLLSPTSVSEGVGSSTTVTVSEGGYSGAFSAGSCAVATIAQLGATNSFSVTGSSPGQCSVVFSGSGSTQAVLAVTVTSAACTAASQSGTDLSQSYCATFSGMTDTLYSFTGQLNFSTNASGAISTCSFSSSGTVSAGGGTVTTGPTTCTGSLITSGTVLCGTFTFTGSPSAPAFEVQDNATNAFCGNLGTNETTISGRYDFGEFGPGGGGATGTFSTP